MAYGVHQFSRIAGYTGASRDILADRLRKLENAGVVERRQYSEHPRVTNTTWPRRAVSSSGPLESGPGPGKRTWPHERSGAFASSRPLGGERAVDPLSGLRILRPDRLASRPGARLWSVQKARWVRPSTPKARLGRWPAARSWRRRLGRAGHCVTAQVAGAGVDRTLRNDCAVDEPQLPGVEPAPLPCSRRARAAGAGS
ncbi:winged helix-turn-helix transcriptional regulator [Streptomyces sp. NPDC001156]